MGNVLSSWLKYKTHYQITLLPPSVQYYIYIVFCLIYMNKYKTHYQITLLPPYINSEHMTHNQIT